MFNIDGVCRIHSDECRVLYVVCSVCVCVCLCVHVFAEWISVFVCFYECMRLCVFEYVYISVTKICAFVCLFS